MSRSRSTRGGVQYPAVRLADSFITLRLNLVVQGFGVWGDCDAERRGSGGEMGGREDMETLLHGSRGTSPPNHHCHHFESILPRLIHPIPPVRILCIDDYFDFPFPNHP